MVVGGGADEGGFGEGGLVRVVWLGEVKGKEVGSATAATCCSYGEMGDVRRWRNV